MAYVHFVRRCCTQADGHAEQPGVFNISGATVDDRPVTSQPIGVSSTAGHGAGTTPIVMGFTSPPPDDFDRTQSTAIPMPYH